MCRKNGACDRLQRSGALNNVSAKSTRVAFPPTAGDRRIPLAQRRIFRIGWDSTTVTLVRVGAPFRASCPFRTL
jgi:hypothetical protein